MSISFSVDKSASPLLSAWEKISVPAPTAQSATAESAGDIVNVRSQARLLDDSEVESTLQSTMSMIGEDFFGAMSAHQGLDPSRVAALLA